MMHNDGGGRLLRNKLELLCQLHADSFGLKQFEELGLVFQIRARRISKTVTRALIILAEQLPDLLRIFSCNPQFLANTLMEQLCKRLCTLDAQSVEIKIVFISVGFKELA